MLEQIHLFFVLSFILLLQGCGEPEVEGSYYRLDRCRQELLASEDIDKSEKIDKIVVQKKEHKMYLYRQGEVVATFPVSLGKNPIGRKRQRGDNKTPEGEFYIEKKLCSPKYYRSLCISYPDPKTRQEAQRRGVDPGGEITIHAQPTWNADGHADTYTLSHDWTQGCIAVTNDTMKKLWYAVAEGVPITIK